jgi:hypothetical protein
VAAPGATFLLFAFGATGPGPGFATEAEIRQRFGRDFDLTEVRPGDAFRKQTWYRMIRR